MARRLEKGGRAFAASHLERATDGLFRLSFEVPLANGFEVSDMREIDLKGPHRFLQDTVYKRLSISQVDELFLRKRGMGNAPVVKYGDLDLIHYGKDRSPFRLFGFYNDSGYFVVCRIDGGHRTHEA